MTLRHWTPNRPERNTALARRLARAFARLEVGVGRALFASAPIALGLSLLPDSGAAHDVSTSLAARVQPTALVLVLLWMLLLPVMALPVSPVALLEVVDGYLVGVTVLGRRRVDLESVRLVRSVPIARSTVHLLRDRRRRWLLVEVGLGEDVSGDKPPETVLAAAEKATIRWYMFVLGFFSLLTWMCVAVVTVLGIIYLWIGRSQ